MLIAAELPIVVVEIGLAALTSFTLVGPLGVPVVGPAALLRIGLTVIARTGEVWHAIAGRGFGRASR